MYLTDISVNAGPDAHLQEARKHAEVLWQRAPIGVVEATVDGVITSVNDALAAMLGYRPQDLVGKFVTDLADPAEAAAIKASIQKLLGGQGQTGERRYLSADGRSIPVHVSTAALHGAHGEVSRLAGFVVDMSEHHAQRDALSAALVDVAAARDELDRRQRLTDTLLETIEVGIVSCAADGGDVVRNRAARAMLGPHHDELGDTLQSTPALIDILDAVGDRVEAVDYPLARALRGETVGAAGNVDYKIGPVGGPHRDVVVRGSRLTGADGTLLGAVVALTDVTAERNVSRELAVERERLNEAQRVGQLGSFAYEVASGQFTFSEQIYRIWGLEQGADLAARRAEMIHRDDLHRVSHGWDAALVVGGAHDVEYRIVRPDGLLRHLQVAFEVVLDPAGHAVFVHGTHLDVTDLTLAQRMAVEASTLFQAILAATPDYTFVTDVGTGAVIYGSPGKTILGITTEQLEALGPSIIATLVHPEEQHRLRAATQAAGDLADGEVVQIRYKARHTDGSWHWLSRRVTPFRRDVSTGKVVEVLGVVRDVTELVEAEERLAHSALHDPLTGLPNRALLMDRLDAALARADQMQREVAILFCDLDGFKSVNDTAGHAAGDAVLIETAARLRVVLRQHDTIARVGGDEFVVVVEPWNRPDRKVATGRTAAPGHVAPLDDRALAVSLAGRIADALRQPITVNDGEFVVTVSIGITYAGKDSNLATVPATAGSVLRNADVAMYWAKKGGKDRFEVYRVPSAGPSRM